MTPRQYSALSKRRLQDDETWDKRAALAPWVWMNTNRDPDKAPLKLSDIIPWSRRKKRKQTVEDMQRTLIDLNAAFGGEVPEE